jgi:outer membrane autotransporter protein
MLLLLAPTMVWGLYSPTISEGHGDITVRNVDKLGWIVGGEYGIMENMAVIADLGEDDYYRVGIKIAFSPEVAFLGGFHESDLFLGVDYGKEFTDDFSGIAEFNIFESDDEVAADYEVGCKFNLTDQLDLRTGLMGAITKSDSTYNFMLGFGYNF